MEEKTAGSQSDIEITTHDMEDHDLYEFFKYWRDQVTLESDPPDTSDCYLPK